MHACMQVRIPLFDAQYGVGGGPAFFPLNVHVAAICADIGVRLLWNEPLLHTHLVRQSEVELSVLAEGEVLTCRAWAPDGTLLLGTDQGRLLQVDIRAQHILIIQAWCLGPGVCAYLSVCRVQPSQRPNLRLQRGYGRHCLQGCGCMWSISAS